MGAWAGGVGEGETDFFSILIYFNKYLRNKLLQKFFFKSVSRASPSDAIYEKVMPVHLT
jgi:hypothetical protein